MSLFHCSVSGPHRGGQQLSPLAKLGGGGGYHEGSVSVQTIFQILVRTLYSGRGAGGSRWSLVVVNPPPKDFNDPTPSRQDGSEMPRAPTFRRRDKQIF